MLDIIKKIKKIEKEVIKPEPENNKPLLEDVARQEREKARQEFWRGYDKHHTKEISDMLNSVPKEKKKKGGREDYS